MSTPALELPSTPLAGPRAWPAARRLRACLFRLWHRTRVQRRGPGHTVTLADALLDCCQITLTGRSNRLEIGAGARLWNVSISLHGEGLHCRIGAGCRLRGGTLVIEDHGSRVEIGPQSTLFAPVIVASEGGAIVLGRDCLAAYGVDLRNSDGHSILDATGRRVNAARDIAIGRHVWLGLHAQVLKGVTIGDDAIVAARALVTRDVPMRALVGGVPARTLRESVTWDHRRLHDAPVEAREPARKAS